MTGSQSTIEARVLRWLKRERMECQVGLIRRRLRLSSGQVSDALQRLRHKGLVYREVGHCQDTRSYWGAT